MSKSFNSTSKFFVSGSWQPISVLVAGLMFSLVSSNLQAESASASPGQVEPSGYLAQTNDSDERIQLKQVDLNFASAEQLASTISGIGPAKAAAIVAYREQHGAFRTVEDILNVPGIGEVTLAKIRAFLSVTSKGLNPGGSPVADG